MFFINVKRFAGAMALAGALAGGEAVAAPGGWELDEGRGWLFGTVHLADPRVADLPDQVTSAFDSCATVFTEVSMDADGLQGQMQGMMLEKGRTLSGLLGESMAERLDVYLQNLAPGLSIEPFEQMKPWAMAVSLPLLEDQMRNPGGDPMDLAIFNAAKTAGKRTGGLETLAEQIAYFVELSEQQQINLLEQTLDYLETDVEGSALDATIEWYLDGSDQSLDQALETLWGQAQETPEAEWVEERLILHRNRLMAERIHAVLEEEEGFPKCFAVGAAHMLGEQGIPALLKAEGYVLKRAE